MTTSGFVIRNKERHILGYGFRVHDLTTTTAMAKVTAMFHEVQFTSEIGFMHVLFESGSKLTIKNITSLDEDCSEMRPIT